MASSEPSTLNLDFMDEIFDFLLSQPSIEAVANFQVSEAFQSYSYGLLEANKSPNWIA